MVRKIAIAALAAAALGCLPAFGQETDELEGAPGWQKAAKPAPVQIQKQAPPQKKAAPTAPPATQTPQKQAQASADKLKTDQVRLAQQAEAQKAEQTRLAQQAADLKAQQARLDARAAQLAAEERRLEQLRIDQDAAQAVKLAELTRQRDEATREAALHSERQRQTADLSGEANRTVRPSGDPDRNAGDDDAVDGLPDAPAETRRPLYARFDFVAAERSCIRAGEDAALARDFYSARYDTAPSVFQDGGWELRGRMRLQDRRGYLILNTVCEVDADGEAQRFVFLR